MIRRIAFFRYRSNIHYTLGSFYHPLYQSPKHCFIIQFNLKVIKDCILINNEKPFEERLIVLIGLPELPRSTS